MSANDTANGNWVYTYDDLNRLISSVGGPNDYTYTYDYDRFGNRWNQKLNGGCTAGTSACVQFDANNHMTNLVQSYDAAGNVVSDSMHSYAYDAENRLGSLDGGATTYLYDAEGRRLERRTNGTATRDWYYNRDGTTLIEIAPPYPLYQEMYAAGLHIATRTLNAAHNGTDEYFHHLDWLGTERARTDWSGNLCETVVSLPFGDGETPSTSCPEGDVSPMHFTGKERDIESGLDNFGARYNSSSFGRFMSPNPTGGRPAFPQSWNAYAYVLNNPLNAVDPNGLDCVYLNDAGNGIESIDQNSNAGECHQNGGAWADGTITNVTFDPNSNDVLLGYANAGANGSVDYSQITATPGQFNPGDEIYGLANDINQMHLEGGIFETYGIGVAFGATGGTACSVFCGQLGIGTLTTLGATAATAGPAAQNPELQNFINMLFKSTDELPDGTMGAVRYELRTGDLLSKAGHSIKAKQIINGLQKLINTGTLSQTDTATAKGLIQDLKDALSTQPW